MNSCRSTRALVCQVQRLLPGIVSGDWGIKDHCAVLPFLLLCFITFC